tara:strand:- start:7162 stop:7665 length:504 start_codon:yes stop_codon:yes gene_type:complete
MELNKLLVKYQNPLHFFALKLTSNDDDAQDLLQETMMKALQYKEKVEASTSVKSWLYTIMKNTFINQYRRSRKLGEIMQTLESKNYLSSSSSNLSITPDRNLNVSDMEFQIEKLNDELRIPFQMKLNGFKYHEIGDHMGIPLGTVKSRIFLARKELTSKLQDFRPNA